MPIIQLPNGAYANIDDGASEETIAKLRAANPARKSGTQKKRASVAVKPLNAEQAEVERRVKARSGSFRNSAPFSALRKFAGGYLMSGLDEAAGGVGAVIRGVPNAIRQGDIGEIGKEYRITRDVVKKEEANATNERPVSGLAAEIAGALVNPVGAGGKALMAGGKLLTKAATRVGPRAAKALGAAGSGAGRVGQRIDKAPVIAQAALAGGNQGALNAIGASEDDVAGSAGRGFLSGAAGGAAFGTAMHTGQRVRQIIGDTKPAAASRKAYERIADLLSNGKTTPERVALQIDRAKRAGSDAMVMDMTPGLRTEAGVISRKTSVPNSNDLIERGDARLEARPQLFEDEIRRAIQPKTGQDVAARGEQIKGARKAAGKTDYEAAFDEPIGWTDELDKFVSKPNPLVKSAITRAEKLMRSQDLDPKQVGFVYEGGEALTKIRKPTMRTFDYIKRGFDAEIKSAYKAGDMDEARILSEQLTTLKTELGKLNPKYAETLAKQRDFFQQEEALKLGGTVIKRLRTEPKTVLAELKGLDKTKTEDARTGIVEAIIALRTQKADPVKFLRGVMRSPEQRQVLEFAFGSSAKLKQFEKFLSRELRANRADVLTAPGRQSETARFMMGDDDLSSGGKVAFEGARGFGFGGLTGATTNTVRALNDLRKGIGTDAQNEIARILMGNGRDLVKGVKGAQDFRKVRAGENKERAIRAAKAGQQLITGAAGD